MKAFLAWPMLFLPLCANALGVKDIEVFSALNQPLNARIELVSIKGLDIQDIKVRLASPKVFNEAGIGRPYFLTRLRFDPKVATDGNPYIQISSKDVVREPYLDFMLEINWRGSSLIKEFTVLLDPVILRRASSEPTKSAAEPLSSNTPSAKKQGYGPVQEAETLWVIAQKTRPSTSIPIKQMIMAIHQKNPDAFVNGNINLLKQGVTLRIPDQRSIMAITYRTALKLYTKQEQKWKGGQSTTDEPAATTGAAPATSRETTPTLLAKPDTETAAPETTQAKEEAKQPQTQTESVTETANKAQDKLQIVATPESQMNEIKPNQEVKVYPKGEIEQLRESITDTTDNISALESINRDLVQLRSALQSKLSLIQEELDKTDRAIAIVSARLGASNIDTSQTTPAEDNTENTTTPQPAPVKPVTLEGDATDAQLKTDQEIAVKMQQDPAENAPRLIDAVEPEQASGINITTDLLASERINKLETKIASLKSQGETIQAQKYLIMVLILAFLAGLAFIVISNRKHSFAETKSPLNPILDRLNQFIQTANIDTRAAAPTSEIKQAHLQKHPEMPFDEPHTGTEEEISFAEPPATLSNQDSDRHTAESVPDTTDDQPTPNANLFKTSRNEADQDIDYILTSVDVYLAYRRFSEAEAILCDAIEKHPNLPDPKAKLLEIYAFKKDAEAFSQYLEKYREELSTQAPRLWEHTLLLGMQLIPNHPHIKAYAKETQGTTPSNTNLQRNPDTSGIEVAHDTLVDELVIEDIDMPDDDLFRIDEDDSDQFILDIDLRESKKQ